MTRAEETKDGVDGTVGRGTVDPQDYFVHTGRGTPAGHYLRMFWQPVSLSEDIHSGRARPIRVMSEDLTLYRGQTGAAHLLAFRCAHRGTQLSTGWVEGDDLRCFYHGWKYDPTGQCVEQPAEPEPFCQRIKIRSYPIREYLGLIFAYLGQGDPPPLPRFPVFEDDSLGARDVDTYTWPCNYFNSLENDGYHNHWVHREFYLGGDRMAIPRLRCEETDYGIVTWAQRPEISQQWELSSLFYMPNIIQFGVGEPIGGNPQYAIAWRVPVDDERFVSFGVRMTHMSGDSRRQFEERQGARKAAAAKLTPHKVLGDAVLRGETRIEDIEDRHVDRSRLFHTQDYVAQVGQGAIIDRSRDHLGGNDVQVTTLRHIFTRELRALAAGQPLKQWVTRSEAIGAW